jgi:hypothetical protein
MKFAILVTLISSVAAFTGAPLKTAVSTSLDCFCIAFFVD